MNPFDEIDFLRRVHRNAPIDLHGEVLFGNLQVASVPFLRLFHACMRATGTTTSTWKVFRRVQRAFNLARYVEYSSSLQGSRIECGVFNGFSALLACNVLRERLSGFDGKEFYLCDSFAGLSKPGEEDRYGATASGEPRETRAAHDEGYFAVDQAIVARHFATFPLVTFLKGFIPGVLSELPQRSWAFVHIDVDLYEPTLGCLEYFVPRMERGGVILNDDFGSTLFPGAGKAWKEFFERTRLPYVVLDSGQSVFVNR